MADLKSNGVRQRGKKASKKKGTQAPAPAPNGKDTSSSSSTDNGTPQTKTESYWDVAKPMVWITAAVLIPYGLYNLYFYLFLQRPDILSIMTFHTLQPRPPVQLTDPRQVLIVGSMSSGTSQVAHDLQTKFGLEIGHENAEASWSFVRDGTVSWFHGIRYIPRPGIDTLASDKQKGEILFQTLINRLCQQLHPNMGFHPFMFRDGNCSVRQNWDSCWRDECKQVVKLEWGCGLRLRDDGNGDACVTPFQKVLHQTRHPLRTIESLVTKFCIGTVEGKVQPVFLRFASVLFPHRYFSEMSCIEAAGYFVDEYNNAMMAAELDGTFRIEDLTPCGVAKLAGFMADDDVIYESNQERVLNVCNNQDSDANAVMIKEINKVNKGKLSLDWDDLLGGKHGSREQAGDSKLQERIKELARKQGYQ